MDEVPFTTLLEKVIDNRGRSAPTSASGIPLIATNCVKDVGLYPVLERVRYVDQQTYDGWFRGHPEPGDILFVCKGTPGRVVMVPDPVGFCVAQDMVSLRVDETKVYPRFLFAALRSPGVRSQIENMHVGTLIPHFKKADFDKLRIPVPDRRSQVEIGDLYYELSAKFESARRSIALLDNIGLTIFSSTFLDPEASEKRRLADLCSFVKGKKPRDTNPAPEAGFLPYLTIDAMTRGLISYASTDRAVVAEPTDILMVMDGASSGVVFQGRHGVVASTFARIPVSDPSMRDVVLQALKYFGSEIRRQNTGSAIPHVAKNVVLALEFAVPANFASERAKLAAINERIAGYQDECRRLVELRDSLLPDLLAGRLRIAPGSAAA